MRLSFGWISIAIAVSVLVGTTGCVSTGKYEKLENERNRLSSEVKNLQTTNSQLSNKVDTAESEQATYERLVGELKAEVAAGHIQIKQLVDGIEVSVSDEILFGSGSTNLSKTGRNVIGRIAKQLAKETALVTVEGHTDSYMIGEALRAQYPSNWELAGARAAKVVRRLSAEGVDPKRLRAVSFGPFDPISSNDTAAGRAKNRRTEIVLRPIPR